MAPEYNGAWAVVGWRRQRVLMIGTGLLAVLRPDELVALVAHELGPARNGDARRGVIVGGAVDGLAELYALMGPGDAPRNADMFVDAAVPVAQLLSRVVSLPILGVLLAEAHLLLGDARRAELLADDRAAAHRPPRGPGAATAGGRARRWAPSSPGGGDRRARAGARRRGARPRAWPSLRRVTVSLQRKGGRRVERRRQAWIAVPGSAGTAWAVWPS